MKILEYDHVDPEKVMFVNKLELDFSLTPEMAEHIRRTDPRPFPCLAVYAVEDDDVLGQIGIFHLPMISTEGREDVGGIWAAVIHPQYSGFGVASRLLDEAHARMREAGLRFSTLGTNRNLAVFNLFRNHGYEDINIWTTAFARWETAHQPTRLRAQPLGSEGYDFVEQIFDDIAKDYFGFAWRYRPFARLRQDVKPSDIWILRENNNVIGYAIAHLDQTIMSISNVVLQRTIDIAEAIAALAAELKSTYIQVTTSRPTEITSLRFAGYYIAQPSRDAFMLKPLTPDVTIHDARALFGLGSDQFLISWLDIT